MQVMVASTYRGEQRTVPIYVKYVFVPPTRLYMHFMAQGREEIRKVARRKQNDYMGQCDLYCWRSSEEV